MQRPGQCYRWKKLIGGIALGATVVMLGAGALFWISRTDAPPAVSISLLGYTNRVGPFASLAITNRSSSAITLDPTCLVCYSPTRGVSPRRPNSFDGNRFAVTRLAPNQGFVQEFFVFPASKGEWRFQCYAAHSSGWLEVRRSVERRFEKLFRRVGFRLTSKAWHRIQTEWRNTPP